MAGPREGLAGGAVRLTDSLKHNRFSIVSVDKAAGTVRVRGESEV